MAVSATLVVALGSFAIALKMIFQEGCSFLSAKNKASLITAISEANARADAEKERANEAEQRAEDAEQRAEDADQRADDAEANQERYCAEADLKATQKIASAMEAERTRSERKIALVKRNMCGYVMSIQKFADARASLAESQSKHRISAADAELSELLAEKAQLEATISTMKQQLVVAETSAIEARAKLQIAEAHASLKIAMAEAEVAAARAAQQTSEAKNMRAEATLQGKGLFAIKDSGHMEAEEFGAKIWDEDELFPGFWGAS